MRDTSDFTDGTEQAKPATSPRPRTTTARSKPEGAVPGNNQEQEARPTTRRRPPNSQGPARPHNENPRPHNGNENSSATTSTPAAHPRPAQNQPHHPAGGAQRGGGNYG